MWGQNWSTMIWTAASAVPAIQFWGAMALGAALMFFGSQAVKRGASPRAIGLIALVIASVLPITGALASLPFTFTNGTIADANQVNSNFNSLDSRVSGLQTNALTTISSSNLNLTDSSTADWEPFSVTCINQLNANGGTCSGNACGSIPDACVIGAQRKCVEGLGFRFGFFNGEVSSPNTASIICVK